MYFIRFYLSLDSSAVSEDETVCKRRTDIIKLTVSELSLVE